MANRILELQQERAALVDAIGVILQPGRTEKRSFTEDELTRVAEKELAITGINASLEVEQRVAALGNIHTDKPHRTGRVESIHDNTLDKPFGPEERSGETGKQRKARIALALGEQLQAVRQAALTPHTVDGRLYEVQKRAAAAGLSEAVPADGGFLIQPDTSAEIMQIAHDTGLVYPIARKLPLSEATNAIKIPGIDEQSRANGSRWGGEQPGKIEELFDALNQHTLNPIYETSTKYFCEEGVNFRRLKNSSFFSSKVRRR